MLVVPGSARLRIEAETAALADVFNDSGAESGFAAGSMCR